MFGYRLLYCVTLLAVFIFYLAYSPWFSWYLLVLVLLLIPLDLALSLPGMLSKSLTISAPVSVDKDAEGMLRISAINHKPFPVRCLYVRLLILGDDFFAQNKLRVPSYEGSRRDIPIDTSQAGLTVFKVSHVYAVSLIGLFSKKISVECKASVLVMPLPSRPANTIALPRNLTLRPKPGGGYSEDHDMRSYRPGDPVNNIHWKLSAKYDSLIIREPLIPPQQSRLVHIIPWEDTAQRELALARLRWVSQYLLSKGLTYNIKYGDRLQVEEISCEAELTDFLRRVLDRSSLQAVMYYPRLTRYTWIFKVSGRE